jgi:ferredoxin
MTYIITEPCIGEKDAACVDVCPVNCIHAREDDEQYYINPHACIDCGACQPVCPVNAIYAADAVPDHWHSFIAINAAYFTRPEH